MMAAMIRGLPTMASSTYVNKSIKHVKNVQRN